MSTVVASPALDADTHASAVEGVAPSPPARSRIDGRALWIWVMSGVLVLYLGINGGGYDLVVRNDAGVVVWWVLLVGAAFGVLPTARFSRAGWVGVSLFGGFLLWSAVASTWSLSSEDSLQEVSRLASYFGVLLLAMTTYRDRRRALGHAVAAVASALVVIIALALMARLRPGSFPGAQATSVLLPGARGRLNWPLDYWNGLAALVALAIPLLVSIATSSRRIGVQALAAAAIPMAALCGFLTFSRGGALEIAAALLVFIALAPERIPKLATLLVSAAGSAGLILDASHRSALEQGLNTASARQEGGTLLLALVVVCVLVGLAQVAVGLAARSARPRGLLTTSPRRARVLLAMGLVAAGALLLALHAPVHLTHAWQDFKGARGGAVTQTAFGRFSTLNGEGRYQFWKAALDAMPGHWLGGWGPGTFQLLWLPRAPFWSYVINAHSLYVETLAGVGIVGLALLMGFFLAILGAGLHRVVRDRAEARTQAAAVIAAWCAFLVAAAVDWVWQLPVLVVALLLLTAGLLAPAGLARTSTTRGSNGRRPDRRRLSLYAARAGIVTLAAACLIAIGVPLASTKALRKSQAAANAGETSLALADAQTAIRVEPGAASPELQAALVLELQRRFSSAVAYARAATSDEPGDWQMWLVRSRLEAEAGHPRLAVAAYRRAQSLNPQSPIFTS